jgi:hypothetical protein
MEYIVNKQTLLKSENNLHTKIFFETLLKSKCFSTTECIEALEQLIRNKLHNNITEILYIACLSKLFDFTYDLFPVIEYYKIKRYSIQAYDWMLNMKKFKEDFYDVFIGLHLEEYYKELIDNDNLIV